MLLRSLVFSRRLRGLSIPPVPSSRRLGFVRSSPSASGYRFTLVQDTVANKQDYVQLGESCARVCQILDRGFDERRMDELTLSVLEAIGKFTV